MTSSPLRFELSLLGAFSAAWLLAIAVLFGILPVAGVLRIDLYTYYGVAALLGWLAGNLYVQRRRILPRGLWRRRLLLVYLIGPPGFLYLARGLAPAAEQAAAPLVPVYAFAVDALFFLVPVTLKKR